MDAAPETGMCPLPNGITVDIDLEPDCAEPVITSLAEQLAARGASATFFAPERVARERPRLAQTLVAAGHELGVLTMTAPNGSTPFCASFRGELVSTRDALETSSGVRVRGHRNAGLGVKPGSEWVYDVLLDAGFEHDSSRFPPRYPHPDEAPVPRSIHAVRRWAGTLLEVPVTTGDVLAGRIEIATTGTIRALPTAVWSAVVRKRQALGEPIVLHLRARGLASSPLGRRGRATMNPNTIRKACELAARFDFTSIASAYSAWMGVAPIVDS